MFDNITNTTKKRDFIRFVFCSISFFLVIISYTNINSNYNRLYEIERIELETISNINNYNTNLDTYIISNDKTIKPSEKLDLQRDITFSLLEIISELMFLVMIYAGRINIEGTKRRYNGY